MQLWNGPVGDFVRNGRAGSLTSAMLGKFYTYHGCQPSEAEVRSWENSLAALAEASVPLENRDMGVVIEYHLPFSNQRIDAVFLGNAQSGGAQGVIVELKQWSEVDVEDEFALNVLVQGCEYAHPSQQALDYAGCLRDVHSAFVNGHIAARACSYCHNLLPERANALVSEQFADLLRESPLFKQGDERNLEQHLANEAGHGSGMSLMRDYTTGKFQPSKKLIEVLDATLKNNAEWHLLGRQREAYNSVFAQVRRLHKKRGRFAVLIRGGPGTGKTVIAVQLLADCLRLGLSAAHSTGGKAFTTALRSKFKGAERLFIWNMATRNAPPASLDLLLVDEAHRVRETSNNRFTSTASRSERSQMEELLDCSKVTVFLLDDNQYVRPDEIGSSKLVRETTGHLGIPLKEFDLDTQFRCGGCTEYASWIDFVLGFELIRPKSWGQRYNFSVVKSPKDLDDFMATAKRSGERARLAAGFCWEWSDPNEDGSLVADVVISGWSRPWNAKHAKKKRYTPKNDPYTLWAETAVGESQIGCVYSAQGFEFDRMGIIWGPDLVWRRGQWVAQREHCFDRPVRSRKADTLRLVRNAYRVLLTRGIRETALLCLDAETRSHIEEELKQMAPRHADQEN